MTKILSILLGIGILLYIVLFILFGIVLAGRKDEKNDSNTGKTANKNVPLCSGCKVGRESYALDKHSEECPFLSSWKTGKCSYFVPIEPFERTGRS